MPEDVLKLGFYISSVMKQQMSEIRKKSLKATFQGQQNFLVALHISIEFCDVALFLEQKRLSAHHDVSNHVSMHANDEMHCHNANSVALNPQSEYE